MSALFDRRFREMLQTILRRGRRLRGRRAEEAPSRKLALATSGTFAGHRAYSDGEDVRTLDWNAYARTGDLFLKVLEEDERHTLTILLDCSPSMTAGTPPRFDGARRLAAILGGLALARLDDVRVVAGAGQVSTFDSAAGLPRLLRALEHLSPDDDDPSARIQVPLERGWLGSVCWISDFAEPDEFDRALRLSRQHRRRVLGVLPAIQDDLLPQVGGWLWIRDPESGEADRIRVDAELRAALERELERLRRHQDGVFSASGVRLVRFPVPAPGDYRVASWFPGEWIRSL